MRMAIVVMVMFGLTSPSVAQKPPAKPAAKAAQPAKPAKWTEQELSDELVNQAIARGVKWLWSKQDPKEFHWEIIKDAAFEKQWAKKGELLAGWQKQTYVHDLADYSGITSVVLLALQRTGASPQDPRFAQALEWVKKAPATACYPNALRAILFSSLSEKDLKQLSEGKQWLLGAVYADGGTGYLPPTREKALKPGPNSSDISNTQYAVLAAWALDDAGMEVPNRYWKLIQGHFLGSQNKDGGWGYRGPAGGEGTLTSYTGMTLAGVASQFIVWDKLYVANCNQAVDPKLAKSIEDGLDWLAKNWTPIKNTGYSNENAFRLYCLYGVERVAVAGGLKYFGDKNWWELGARYALFAQKPDGSWGEDFMTAAPANTAFALLFLSYGRAPVVMNKLAYGDEKLKLTWDRNATQWNSRPRNLARLTAWMNKAYESLHNWQITPIDRPVAELLDAPILLISGRNALHLTAEEKGKLRQYVLAGGLLLGEAIDGSKVFSDSFRALLAELFSELELKPVGEDHPLLTAHWRLKAPGTPGGPPPLEYLSNGVRTLAVLCPRELSCTWQQYAVSSGRTHFELGANLVQYVSDRGRGLLGRGASYMIADHGHRPEAKITVGRLSWGSSRTGWDPEPAGWQRMDVAMRNRKLLSVSTTQCDLSEPLDAKAIPLLHVTGTSGIVLGEVQKANLKKYVADGGTVLADGAGGSRLFIESFEKLAGELFGPLIPASPSWLEHATDNGDVQVRHVAGLPVSTRPVQMTGCKVADRWVVLCLGYDLSAAMVGNPNLEPVGLSPAAAEKFVAAMLTAFKN